jgi:3-oxoacyl-[acyl-carrier protein] reductase
MTGSLSDKVALVTGGSRGIGRSIAERLAADGAAVAVAARGKEAAEEVAAALRDRGAKAHALALDVGDLAAVEKAAGEIAEALGKVSILVNNAGITRDQLLVRMKDEDWDEVMATNLKGTFHCTRVFAKDMMRARWGRIVNISSVIGTLGNAGQANYAASKAGIHGFTRSVARELAPRGVTANAVAPGFIETDMTAALTEEQRTGMLAGIPLGRLGQPGDVAGVVAFLAGEAAGYVTGQVIHVDGGMVMA